MIPQMVFQKLTTDPGLSALIAERAYPLVLPQAPTMPALTYRKISDTGLAQTAAVHRDRYQITVYALTYLAAQAVAAALQNALENWTSANIRSALKVNHVDIYDDDTKLFIVITDYLLVISD